MNSATVKIIVSLFVSFFLIVDLTEAQEHTIKISGDSSIYISKEVIKVEGPDIKKIPDWFANLPTVLRIEIKETSIVNIDVKILNAAVIQISDNESLVSVDNISSLTGGISLSQNRNIDTLENCTVNDLLLVTFADITKANISQCFDAGTTSIQTLALANNKFRDDIYRSLERLIFSNLSSLSLNGDKSITELPRSLFRSGIRQLLISDSAITKFPEMLPLFEKLNDLQFNNACIEKFEAKLFYQVFTKQAIDNISPPDFSSYTRGDHCG